jgi:hypothetical protein
VWDGGVWGGIGNCGAVASGAVAVGRWRWGVCIWGGVGRCLMGRYAVWGGVGRCGQMELWNVTVAPAYLCADAGRKAGDRADETAEETAARQRGGAPGYVTANR